MFLTDNALNVLTADTYNGIGKAWIISNMSKGQSIKSIVDLLVEHKKSKTQKKAISKSVLEEVGEEAVILDYETITEEDFEERRKNIRNKIEKLDGFIDGVVALGDDHFPSNRGKVIPSERPVAIFYKGNIDLLSNTNKNVSVIGLLNPDLNIEKREQVLVEELVQSGTTIVSGLALGCDSIAHRQAMNSKGKTIAILPSTLDQILPASNKELADEIVRGNGLLITEYYEKPKFSQEQRGRYQERDRLQALYSDAVILVASYAENDDGNDSGSRLAMKYAKKYQIPRAVMYEPDEDKDNPKFELNRFLVNETTEITIINQSNLETAIKDILKNKAGNLKLF